MLQCLPTVIPLHETDDLRSSQPPILQSPHLQTPLQPQRYFCMRIGQLLLNQLERSEPGAGRIDEALGILPSTLEAVLKRTHHAS